MDIAQGGDSPEGFLEEVFRALLGPGVRWEEGGGPVTVGNLCAEPAREHSSFALCCP